MVDNCVVVGSMGRAGSTLLYKSITDSMGYSSKLSCFRKSLDICDYENGAVYKTHVLPPNNPPKNAKFIWTFADPYEVVISVIRQQENKGIEWVKNHFDNLGGEFDKYDSIIDYDALHLEEHFDRWYDKQNFDLVTVKYRSLWDYQKELSNFVGSYIDLPVKNVRNRRFGSLDDDVQNRMIDTYGNLHEKVFSADEFRKF